MTGGQKKIGAADIDALANSVSAAPTPGIGDAFSIERAAGRVIDQMRHACKGCALPLAASAVTTYIFCDDLQDAASGDLFSDVHLAWTSDLTTVYSELENRVILVSRNGNAGCASKATFGSFKEQAGFVAKLQLQDLATVVFYPGKSLYSIYPSGLVSDFEHRPFGTISSLLVGDELKQVLSHFEKKWVNAPAGNRKLWAKFKGTSHVPCANTEKVIQEHMQLHLIASDRSATVVEEIWNTDGRADLFLFSALQVTEGSIVLELKVLRSHSHPENPVEKKGKVVVSTVANTTNVTNALEVVKQAASYKVELPASRAFARLYDMRMSPADKQSLNEAQTLASKLAVEFDVCTVHYTVQESRDAKIEALLEKASATSGK